jgi:hypothetical protein
MRAINYMPSSKKERKIEIDIKQAIPLAMPHSTYNHIRPSDLRVQVYCFPFLFFHSSVAVSIVK